MAFDSLVIQLQLVLSHTDVLGRGNCYDIKFSRPQTGMGRTVTDRTSCTKFWGKYESVGSPREKTQFCRVHKKKHSHFCRVGRNSYLFCRVSLYFLFGYSRFGRVSQAVLPILSSPSIIFPGLSGRSSRTPNFVGPPQAVLPVLSRDPVCAPSSIGAIADNFVSRIFTPNSVGATNLANLKPEKLTK
eukprot:SAG31_NODE_1612_length_7743_cov_6.653323_7_plen_187_part_00